MADRPWKREEREAARLLGGRRHWANSGRWVDVESPRYIAQVKHRRTCSLAELERLAVELEARAAAEGKGRVGVVVIKRRAGPGRPTPRLVVLTESAWTALVASLGAPAA